MEENGNSAKFVERRYSSTLTGIVNTIEWVIIALILAFIFRAFVMEAFRIPTGSMAATLRGAHHHLRCEQCGYKYDLGAEMDGKGGPKCPNCNFLVGSPVMKPASNGDRILVLKCIYEFFEPKRWDVVVFKNPGAPEENYIKRLIGLPGEIIGTLDGDFYIDGKILRKPPKVQEELWMVVYDNDYQPVMVPTREGMKPRFDWEFPFVNTSGSVWNTNLFGTTYFTLDSDPAVENTLVYDADLIDHFRGDYAYNQTVLYRNREEPICTDLKVGFYAHRQSGSGFVGASILKYDTRYRGIAGFDGEMIIEKIKDGKASEVARDHGAAFDDSGGVLFELSVVDRQVIFRFGEKELRYEIGQQIEDIDYVEPKGSLVGISGAGKIKLSHVAVFRDIYYTENKSLRPRTGKPFSIGEDEFFVCGDNSPESFDSRKWYDPGEGNSGKKYSKGVVPRDYLMGKAFFLYWGDAFKPLGSRVPIIPNFSEMKVIYGGSEDSL